MWPLLKASDLLRLPALPLDVIGWRWNESTAEGMALMRALACSDSRFQDGDRLAIGFVTDLPLAAYARLRVLHPLLRRLIDQRVPGGYYYEVARTAHMDGVLLDAVRRGASQVVLLGAGYDSRPYRLRERTTGATFFEVDHPRMSRRKREKLASLLGRVPPEVQYVEVDFERDDAGVALLAAAFEKNQRSVWIWSGVSMYLTPAAVDRVLALIRENSAADSVVVLDYLYQEAMDDDDSFFGLKESRRYVESQGEPWRFGISRDAVADFLHERGFALEANLGPDDLERAYLTSGEGTSYGRPSGWIGICQARVISTRSPRR
jgi:methyltransferase (TIGR00027 family)